MTHDELVSAIGAAIRDEMAKLTVPEDEHKQHHDYIRQAIEREARRERFQTAIIEKSLAGLVWTAISACIIGVWHYLSEHWKP